jgi:hypothetical protein
MMKDDSGGVPVVIGGEPGDAMPFWSPERGRTCPERENATIMSMAAEAMMMTRTPGDMGSHTTYEVRGIEPYGSSGQQPVETPFPQTIHVTAGRVLRL